MAADVAVLDHLAALLGIDIEVDQLEAIRALYSNGVVHAAEDIMGLRVRGAGALGTCAGVGASAGGLRLRRRRWPVCAGVGRAGGRRAGMLGR